MNRFFWWLAVAFFCFAPFWYGQVIYFDLTHPELWDRDWMHDPRIYGPGFFILGLLSALFLAAVWLEHKRRRLR